MKKCFLLVMILCLGISTAFAQVTSTTGGIDGRVLDPAGAAVPGAKVTITGPRGSTEVIANEEGFFQVRNLNPGNYSVTIEGAGFKKTSIERVEVLVGKNNTITANLEVGEATATVEVTDVAQIDQSSTAVGQNLNDQLYENIPVQRSVSSLFYLSPSASGGLGGGGDNPSISGGSALDNLYIADGVNITDSAFGGIGTFSRNYLALGTGINTSYIKEVQVKSGGFEPQYGQSTGGIVNIITKSGGNDFSGAVYAYARPKWLEATRRQRDEFRINKIGEVRHREDYDAGVDFSGPVIKDKLFFFGSFNPTVRRDVVIGAHRSAFQLENGAAARIDSGLFNLMGEHTQRYRTLNYAFKLDYTINANHTLAFSIFGDPTKTNNSSFAFLNIDNTTAFANLDFGTRNMSLRYNGAFGSSNPATLSITVSRNDNHFDEFGFDDRFNGILNRTDPVPTATSSAFILNNTRGNYQMIGYGFFEPTTGHTNRFTIDGTKQANFLGTHTFGIGYQYQKAFYEGLRGRSGPKFAIPEENAFGESLVSLGVNPAAIGKLTDATFSLRTQRASCTFCPLFFIPSVNTDVGFGVGWRRVSLQQTRGEFGDNAFDTFGNYHAAYAQDTWRFNKYITAIIGIRWEQEDINGSEIDAQGAEIANISSSFVGTRSKYTFTGQWSPRFGVTVDPMGRGKTKVYYNFGRYHEFLPLDAAERSLSLEQDFLAARFAPLFRIGTAADGPREGERIAILNAFGAPIPSLDAEHTICGSDGRGLLNGIECVFAAGANDPTQVVTPGTKLGYLDEHVVGFEQQLPRNFTLSVRYLDRRIKRVIEDGAILPPEAYNAGVGQTYFLANISSTLDAGINLVQFPFAPEFGVFLLPTGDPEDPFFEAELFINTPGGCAGSVVEVPAIPGVQEAGSFLQPDFFNSPVDVLGNTLSPGGTCFAGTGIDPVTHGSINRPDGLVDGFVDPVRIYRAIEVELNKRFADNWQLLSNVRFASLRGNYEGHLRNDNGQTDPGISSLFDFTQGNFNLLGNQFDVGPLNSDRRVLANIYGSYTFSKDGPASFLNGMTFGANLHGESGIPISEYLAHPAYLNAGEIPVGGRGKLGRTSPFYRLDLHFDYPWQITENSRLSFIADFFNVTNNRTIQRVDEFRENTTGQLNPDFSAPRTFYLPFNLRLGMRFEF
jgi:hypothetical protein